MTLVNKTPSIQAYRLLLYQRPLHPELFGVHDRRIITQSDYELETWIMPGGHVLRFQAANQCLSEAVIDKDDSLPQRGLLQALPCLGEKDLEQTLDGSIRYMTSIQTELLSDNLFAATLNEMKDFAQASEALWFQWSDADGALNLSVLDVQPYKREIHIQSYHLVGSATFVLRTQTIFEIL